MAAKYTKKTKNWTRIRGGQVSVVGWEDLRPGDQFVLVDRRGRTRTFRVDGKVLLTPAAVAAHLARKAAFVQQFPKSDKLKAKLAAYYTAHPPAQPAPPHHL